MKLFGKCKQKGSCICGNCANAPINQKDAITIRKSDGTVETGQAPHVTAYDPLRDRNKANRDLFPERLAFPPKAGSRGVSMTFNEPINLRDKNGNIPAAPPGSSSSQTLLDRTARSTRSWNG